MAKQAKVEPKRITVYVVSEEYPNRAPELRGCGATRRKTTARLDEIHGGWGYRRMVPLAQLHLSPEAAIQAYRDDLLSSAHNYESQARWKRKQAERTIRYAP